MYDREGWSALTKFRKQTLLDLLCVLVLPCWKTIKWLNPQSDLDLTCIPNQHSAIVRAELHSTAWLNTLLQFSRNLSKILLWHCAFRSPYLLYFVVFYYFWDLIDLHASANQAGHLTIVELLLERGIEIHTKWGIVICASIPTFWRILFGNVQSTTTCDKCFCL